MNKVDKRHIAYTGYAKQYDARRFESPGDRYLERVRFQALLRAIGARDFGRRVLDVGCGTGRGEVLLARAGFQRITALDYTDAMLQIAQQKTARLRATGQVRLLRGDAYRLPFPDAAFDLVVSLRFVHMFRFDLQQELVREMARVCRPGGVVAVELENIHKGLFVTRYLEQRRLQTHQKFNSMWEVSRMFSSDLFGRRKVFGSILPKAHRLLHKWPELGERLERIAFLPPLNWLTNEIVVAAQRR
jgi:ubiquinone/menaquinone biosynthesis C-methylase UbiE